MTEAWAASAPGQTPTAGTGVPLHGLDHFPGTAWIVAAVAILLVALYVYFRPRLFRRPGDDEQDNSVFAGRTRQALQITGADAAAFEALIQNLNDCWRANDIDALSLLATPSMATRLAARLQTQLSHDKNWYVHELQLLRSDLIAAWREDDIEHAQMNLRLSTLESNGSGETPRRYVSREIWNFERAGGQHWRIAGVRSVD